MLAPWAARIIAQVPVEDLRERVVRSDFEDAFGDRVPSEALLDAVRGALEENVAVLVGLLCGVTTLEEVELDRPIELGALQARLRITQSAMHRSYRAGFRLIWEALAEALRDGAQAQVAQAEAAGAWLELDLATELHAMTGVVLTYQDFVAERVAERLSAEEELLAMSRAHVRHRLVEAVLDDPAHALSPADLTTIGYPLERHHLAVLLPDLAEGAAGRLAVGLADAAGTRASLTLRRDMERSAVWLGRERPWTHEALDAVTAVLTGVGVLASLGEPGAGVAGFRASLAQAEQTDEIRRAWVGDRAPRVIAHRDVGLEVLLLGDRERARAFVERELGDLAAASNEGVRLRDTLEASLRLGSHVAAAAELGVHEHTVRNRLRRAEEVLGQPLTRRSTEVQVALRLIRLL